jgi:hypothetical protein
MKNYQNYYRAIIVALGCLVVFQFLTMQQLNQQLTETHDEAKKWRHSNRGDWLEVQRLRRLLKATDKELQKFEGFAYLDNIDPWNKLSENDPADVKLAEGIFGKSDEKAASNNH